MSHIKTATVTIGIGHYKRVGKDTFGNYLIQACYERDVNLVVQKRSFAYKLKQVCHELYGWAGLREPEFYETSEGAQLREVVLPAIGKTPRQIWVDFGTKAVRDQVYEPTWLDYLMKGQHELDVMLVTDTRFRNEADAIKQAGGYLVKVVRPGYGPGPKLVGDPPVRNPDRELLGYDGWDYVIGGSGKLSELRRWSDRFAVWLTGSGPRPEQDASERARNLAAEVVEDV
ncbi:MAG: hypothetical protein DWQ31_16890 [Planctomycetota bacterium]|nr:MAG: hypothetical protein DWQ31_16890 [Planctomycetota bacterium]REJ92031.1 MAG: hypothetical protein DWQ35_12840 [Planctomycetota bacterium]REK28567.1 MAG: hypothetical protein DWQ42_04430 [Planctomycetota bacterium]REK39182.1 MAG: hypothetical protein DWQ46_18015 [Planctomycetota bacterium]